MYQDIFYHENIVAAHKIATHLTLLRRGRKLFYIWCTIYIFASVSVIFCPIFKKNFSPGSLYFKNCNLKLNGSLCIDRGPSVSTKISNQQTWKKTSLNFHRNHLISGKRGSEYSCAIRITYLFKLFSLQRCIWSCLWSCQTLLSRRQFPWGI